MAYCALLLEFIRVALISSATFAHGGGLDGNGSHSNRKTGEYHCHMAGCVPPGIAAPQKPPASQQSKAALKEAQKEHRPFSRAYNRADWIDADKDCQNTRAEILIRDSSRPVTYRNAKKCSVITGEWHDPYTGKAWHKASDLDIDHVVPLK